MRIANLALAGVLASLGGMRVASGYAGAIAFGSVALALRGRAGAGRVFPWHACLYAPLWVFERSISVYWALCRKLSEGATEATGVPLTDRFLEIRLVGSRDLDLWIQLRQSLPDPARFFLVAQPPR